ncbi:Kelch repeat-containing protein [Sorangium sp. So ce1099]|uniref:Kelch repeat-containing protein n=1 Tax=Sorangium sp. So ce1099 TaxID=3133331 RepID=UPI003F64110F
MLPRHGDAPIQFRTPAGIEVRVRELGAAGEGVTVDRAVAYRRTGGTSFWTATDHGVEEWLLLDERDAREDEAVAAWEVEGAALRERGEAVELVGELSGAPVLRVTAPRTYAASGRPVAAALRVRGSRIELSVDAARDETLLIDPAWEPVAAMSDARFFHTATLLPSGQVLAAGGFDAGTYHASAELYDPAASTWSRTNSMKAARFLHTATLLPSGQVLIAGGYAPGGPIVSAELYDPTSRTWTDTGRMNHARSAHTATLLSSGQVLVAGRHAESSGPGDAELYDPQTGAWTSTPPMVQPRLEHTATLLPSGQVLVAGGTSSSTAAEPAELYDPETGEWTRTGSLHHARGLHTATLLPSGQVLVAGGALDAVASASAELYDPETGEWTRTGSLNHARGLHTATLLPSGQVLVAGGASDDFVSASAELYEPTAGAWTLTARMEDVRAGHTATLLQSPTVLVAGGRANISPTVASSERFGLALGEACSTTSGCLSGGICVDGTCCRSPCPCGACSPSGLQCATVGSGAKVGQECAPPRCDGETHSYQPALCTAESPTCPEPERVDCVAYRCDQASGACKSECTSLDDCAPRFVCNLQGHCVQPPPAPGAVGGCSAAPSASSSAAPRGLGLLLLGLGAARRRRRSAAGARLSALLAAALLLVGCGAEPEDTSAAALRLRFPAHADAVISAREAFVPAVDGFRLDATDPGGAWLRAARSEVVLPRDGSGEIRFRGAEGGEIRVRELGAFGEGQMAERAVSYGRAGGASYWTATEGGVEEWLLLEEGVARRGEPVASWQVEGAALRERGAAVELVDEESGAAVLRVTAPRAYAASGRTVGLSLRARGSRIELSVDAGGEAVLVDPAWEPAGLMAEARRDHTATLLPNGLVLVAGGWNSRGILDTAELYDPTTGEWIPARPMTLARRDHTATLLRNGSVLVVGGSFGGFDTATAELYDPEADTWTETAVMEFRRREHTATLLRSGLVLVAGGANAAAFHDSVELYDPVLGTWSLTTSMLAVRLRHTATLLDSGEVLLVGGFGTTPATGAELYDPASNTWALTSPVNTARQYHTATRLQDGQVLVAGGSENNDDAPDVRSAELYDPATNTWSSTESMSMRAPHADHAAVRLDNGRVLVTGGDNDAAAQVAELYDPAAGTWTATPPMKTTHQQHTATLLPSGQVLVTGPSRYAERYTGLGAECTLDADCALGVCVEGICCESRCDEPCHTCADIASPGECVPQPRGSDIRKECTDEGCDGACDGSGSCTAVPRGGACSPVECSDETHSMKSIVCPADGARCPDPTSPTREREGCGPYRCDRITGACKDQCASFQDCAPGFACDLTGRCAPHPPAASRGCSVADGSISDSPERGLSALLLALLALALRRPLAPRAVRLRWYAWTLERDPENT